MGVNKAILVGRLGKDPEVRSTPNGQSLAKFSIATDRKWKDRDGNRQEHTEWHNIICWGRQAEIAGQYLHKGKEVYVEGRLQTDSWEDKDTGKKMYRTEIVCDHFQMLGSKPDGASGGNQKAWGGGKDGNASGSSWGASESDLQGGLDDDDIPF